MPRTLFGRVSRACCRQGCRQLQAGRLCSPQKGDAYATLCMSANSARPFPLMKVFVAVSLVLTSSLLAQTPAPGLSSGKHPFTFEDMMKLKRVGAPVPSPDGKWVVFDCEDVDLEPNRKISHLWIVPAQGGDSRRLNPTPNHEERPRFSPDGKQLIWTSKATDPTQSGCAILIRARARLSVSRARSRIFRLARMARSGRRMD